LKRYEVLLTEDAQRDIEEIHRFVAESDSPALADRMLDRLVELAESLVVFPERGAFPRELEALGMRDFRQLFFQPYRVIYRIRDRRVYIYLIADGRRDMQPLLARRLLGG
jgi:Plasmid stabilisation system protein.